MPKPSVFPVPVGACPIMSEPRIAMGSRVFLDRERVGDADRGERVNGLRAGAKLRESRTVGADRSGRDRAVGAGNFTSSSATFRVDNGKIILRRLCASEVFATHEIWGVPLVGRPIFLDVIEGADHWCAGHTRQVTPRATRVPHGVIRLRGDIHAIQYALSTPSSVVYRRQYHIVRET